MEGERNNMFRFSTHELSQDAFICWLINYINTDEEEYKSAAKDFIKLLADKIGDVSFKKYIEENDYKVEIKHQYRNIDVLLKIDNFCIIIEDKIETVEHDDQINKYKYYLLTNGITELEELGVLGEFKIFTCYYKIYDEYRIKDKSVNAIITRKDMINILENAKNTNPFMEDYLEYLREIEKYSNVRDILASEISNIKTSTIRNIAEAIYTGFYNELEKKEKDIIGWGYADNRAGGTWWYASKKYENIKSDEFENIYAEINLKEDRNSIIIKLAKKKETFYLDSDAKIEDYIKSKDYIENGKVKYFDKQKYYICNVVNQNLEEKCEYRCYKILKTKVDIYNKVVTKDLLKKLEVFGISEDDKNAKGTIKKDNNAIYKYYSRIASINVNNYTLEEIEKILNIINKHLENLKIKL